MLFHFLNCSFATVFVAVSILTAPILEGSQIHVKWCYECGYTTTVMPATKLLLSSKFLQLYINVKILFSLLLSLHCCFLCSPLFQVLVNPQCYWKKWNTWFCDSMFSPRFAFLNLTNFEYFWIAWPNHLIYTPVYSNLSYNLCKYHVVKSPLVHHQVFVHLLVGTHFIDKSSSLICWNNSGQNVKLNIVKSYQLLNIM